MRTEDVATTRRLTRTITGRVPTRRVPSFLNLVLDDIWNATICSVSGEIIGPAFLPMTESLATRDLIVTVGPSQILPIDQHDLNKWNAITREDIG